MKIISIVGARPNFMKIAPLDKEFRKHPEINNIIVHTGQHYDNNMSESFFRDLEIRKPDYNLGVGSGLHGEQTGKVMIEFEKICLKEKPDLVVVVGDVNSTVACALVAVKLHIKVAHVEAGLRSFNRKMPEEINRIVTDHLSDYLFVTEKSGIVNLKKEGIPDDKIFFVGNIMIDSLINNLHKINNCNILEENALSKNEYLVLTMHRPENVDHKEKLNNLIETISEVQSKIKIIYPMHPRTKKNIDKLNLNEKINNWTNVLITDPLDYLNFMSLVNNSKGVLTDSGGIQEETTYLKIPCVTMRENTERPSTHEIGSNVIVGLNKEKIINESNKIINNEIKETNIPPLWDGKTASRITNILYKNGSGNNENLD